jgi:hypothetical protein
LFLRELASHFDFCTFITFEFHFILDSDLNPVLEPECIFNSGTGIHSASGSAKAQSCGSFGSGSDSGSTTLALGKRSGTHPSFTSNFSEISYIPYLMYKSSKNLTKYNLNFYKLRMRSLINRKEPEPQFRSSTPAPAHGGNLISAPRLSAPVPQHCNEVLYKKDIGTSDIPKIWGMQSKIRRKIRLDVSP